MRKTGYLLLAVICAGLCACSSPQRTAPIADRSVITSSSVEAPIDKGTVYYTVKSGDTLSQIARRTGYSVAELASWNHLADANDLKVGQVIRIQPSGDGRSGAQTASVGTAPQVQVRSIDTAKKETQTAPKTVKKTETSSATVTASSNNVREAEGISWSWPVQGKVITSFDGSKNLGIDIAGIKGQKVLAAADGTVSFMGRVDFLGNTIIVKHNDAMVMSVYTHNDKNLVKEGQRVERGQQIAEMGNTGSDRVKLHFEIRRYGKPVNPLKYLPAK